MKENGIQKGPSHIYMDNTTSSLIKCMILTNFRCEAQINYIHIIVQQISRIFYTLWAFRVHHCAPEAWIEGVLRRRIFQHGSLITVSQINKTETTWCLRSHVGPSQFPGPQARSVIWFFLSLDSHPFYK